MNDVPGVGECGEYDLYVLFAMRFKWTPEQVNALTPDFIDELLAYQSAEAKYEEKLRKDAERKSKQAKGARG